MEINEIKSREELERDKRDLMEKIEDAKKEQPVNMAYLNTLQDKYEQLTQELENWEAKNFDINIDMEESERQKKKQSEQEQENLNNQEEREQEGQKNLEEQEQEQENLNNQKEEREQKNSEENTKEETNDLKDPKNEKGNEVEALDEQEGQENLNEQEEKEPNEQEEKDEHGNIKLTIAEWEKKSGIRALSWGGLENKKYSEEEFRCEVLGQSDRVYLIQDPSSAESFMKDNEAGWKSVMTSKSTIDMAIRSNNFPIDDINDDSYILMPNNKKIEDRDNDGDIDKNDIYGRQPKDIGESNDTVDEVNEDSILYGIPEEKINGRRAIMVKAIVEEVIKDRRKFVESIIGEGSLEDISKTDLDDVSNQMKFDLDNPPDIQKTQEIEQDDFGEIKPPVV